jgi:hypothetical protein
MSNGSEFSKNPVVEEIMNLVLVICKFGNLGCKEVTNWKDIKHEENCCSMHVEFARCQVAIRLR